MTVFENFRDELFTQAALKGFTDYELYYSAADGFSIRVFEGEIAEYKNTSTEGIGFRGTYNGKMGYAYTENLDIGLIQSLLENATLNAGIIEEEEAEQLFSGSEEYPQVQSFNTALAAVDSGTKIEMAFEMEKYAKNLDPRVKFADYCTISTTESTLAIANSYGLNLFDRRNIANAFLIARVEENGITKSAYENWSGRNFAEFDYKKLAEKAVNAAISYLGASSIPSGQYPVILDQNTAKNLFEIFSSVFVAENCQKGLSLLGRSKIGENIAAPHVTLRDDSVTDLSPGSLSFDAEGVATQNKAIIENGVLKTLLYNTKAAAKDGVNSTGNAAKAGIGGTINTSITNFYLVPGQTSFDEMVQRMKRGVIITDLAGLHSGTNPISGDFSVSADGFLVENGKIIKPVEQITVAGNFYDLLKNIETVGADLRFHSSGIRGIGMPSILVNGLSIGGE